MNPDSLNFKNESELILYLRHLKAYEFVREYSKGKTVLELECGADYSSQFLSKSGKNIVAVDRDQDALNRAINNNTKNNVKYILGDILGFLDLRKSSFDLVISFQVFEHFDRKHSLSFLEIIHKYLKPNGVLFLTTPNRKTRLLPFQKPTNKHHKFEYSAKTLQKTLNTLSPHV